MYSDTGYDMYACYIHAEQLGMVVRKTTEFYHEVEMVGNKIFAQ